MQDSRSNCVGVDMGSVCGVDSGFVGGVARESGAVRVGFYNLVFDM
jgi:hypothetical protein